MSTNTDPLAAAVAARRLSLADIEASIASEMYFTAQNGVDGASDALELHSRHPGGGIHIGGLSCLTFCVLILRNGTKVVGINHGAIDPAQHSAERGREEARKDAVNKVWELMGYELRSRLAQGGAA